MNYGSRYEYIIKSLEAIANNHYIHYYHRHISDSNILAGVFYNEFTKDSMHITIDLGILKDEDITEALNTIEEYLSTYGCDAGRELLDSNPFPFCKNGVKPKYISYKKMFNNAPITRLGDFEKLQISDVIFNHPSTTVLWSDGTKTVVKTQDDDTYDPEKGLAMAICKKYLGNNSSYYKTFKKWLPEEKESDVKTSFTLACERWSETTQILSKSLQKLFS